MLAPLQFHYPRFSAVSVKPPKNEDAECFGHEGQIYYATGEDIIPLWDAYARYDMECVSNQLKKKNNQTAAKNLTAVKASLAAKARN